MNNYLFEIIYYVEWIYLNILYIILFKGVISVSYTHLDVYKRQVCLRYITYCIIKLNCILLNINADAGRYICIESARGVHQANFCLFMFQMLTPVSYTHLDVYKRQA